MGKGGETEKRFWGFGFGFGLVLELGLLSVLVLVVGLKGRGLDVALGL